MTNPTRTLVLMRHSEAGHGGGGDHARPLTPQGEADSRAAGRWVAQHVGGLDLVVVSSALRTRQTWDAMVQGGARTDRVEVRDEVYDASPDELLEVVTTLPDEVGSVLLLGHAPGVPTLAVRLVSDHGPEAGREALDRGFATTTLCRLAADRPWGQVERGTLDLVDLAVPRG